MSTICRAAYRFPSLAVWMSIVRHNLSFYKKLNVSFEYDRWVVEAQLCNCVIRQTRLLGALWKNKCVLVPGAYVGPELVQEGGHSSSGLRVLFSEKVLFDLRAGSR